MSETQPEQTTQDAEKPKEKFGIKHIVSLAFAIGITLAVFLLKDEIGKLGSAGYAGVFVTMLVTSATLILPAPGLALVFVLGKSFSPLLLGVVAGAGSTLGEITGYLAGFSGSGVVEDLEVYRKVEGYVKKYGIVTITVLAAIPNPLFDAAGFAAGALGIPLWQFLLATFIGKTIKCIVVAYAGFYSMGWIEQLVK